MIELDTLLGTLEGKMKPDERERVLRAYRIADEAHAGQKRASGEPYLQHCLAVAMIIAELGLPSPAVIAGLLHDTVEDTSLTLKDLDKEFGSEVSRLVDGVTKLTHLPRVSGRADGRKAQTIVTETELAKETLRKTFLAMGDDVRVVVIKLADRLHNMRTIRHLTREKQERIARETLEIFAPLANRLGIWQIKWELEDLSFRYAYPEEYRRIAAFVDERRVDRELVMNNIIDHLKRILSEEGLTADVKGRPKHLYSIYKKMERKNVPFNQVFDVRGVRIIVENVHDCYLTLGVIHSKWQPMPGAFDDYIATPKDNDYQSLHTAVMYEDGRPLEVQIRTPEMDERSEYGIAAHWRYKEGRKRDDAFERKILWLRHLMEWRQDVDDASDFVDAMKTDVFTDRVYIFTPRGDIIDLPSGSTPIDFAYHIHTDIGHRCRGSKVDGKLVSLDYKLKTGDVLEILTTKRGGPSRDWLNPSLEMVGSQRARSKIRQWFKRQDRELNISHGRLLLERELHRLGMDSHSYDDIAREMDYSSVDDLLAAIGCGDTHLGKIIPRLEKDAEDDREFVPHMDSSFPAHQMSSDEVSILGVSGLLTQLGRCCNPVPGDQVVGYVTRGRGVTVHRRDCPNILRMRDQERLIQVSWGQHMNRYPVSIRIRAYDRDGLMKDVSTLLLNEQISISSLNVSTKNSLATFDMVMSISDINQLSRVLNKIEALPNVLEARRIRPG